MGHPGAALPARGGPAEKRRGPRLPGAADLSEDRDEDQGPECPPGGPDGWGGSGDRALDHRGATMKARATRAIRQPRERSRENLGSQNVELERTLHIVE